MRITIIALGSRGDVQPFVALALGLELAGHDVRIAAACDYSALVESYSVQFEPLVGYIRDLMDPHLVYDMLDGAANPVHFGRRAFAAISPVLPSLLADVRRASRGAEALIVSTLGVYAAFDIAQEMGIPMYMVHMHPYGPTRAFPNVFFPFLPRWVPLRGTYNLLTHRLVEAAFWQFLAAGLNEGLLRTPGRGVSRLELLRRAWLSSDPTLLAYSAMIGPPPPRDWGPQAHITGYWFLDRPRNWQPPPDLVAFLEKGPPPVYVSFGSTLAGRDPDKVTRLIVDALKRAGQRGILYSAWGDLGNSDLPPGVLMVEDVPHDWLFPKVAAVVHHGGAGTTAATLRAGVPSVVVPFYGDMRLWAGRLQRLGVAPAPIPRDHLSVERLADAIKEASDNAGMRARARAIGRRLDAEDGVASAIAALGMENGAGDLCPVVHTASGKEERYATR